MRETMDVVEEKSMRETMREGEEKTARYNDRG